MKQHKFTVRFTDWPEKSKIIKFSNKIYDQHLHILINV